MNAMVDLMSNSVVVVGGDRLGDALARQKLKEYKEYGPRSPILRARSLRR